jgi:biotin synthase
MFERISRLAEQALQDEPPSWDDALWILDGEDVELLPLLHAAYLPRARHFGRKVMVHILNNVQNGLCPEDCGYCSQSRDSDAAIRKYPIKSDADILAEAGLDRLNHNLNTSESHYKKICTTHTYADRVRTLEAAHKFGIETCSLAEAGLDRLNHNLNTSESHYKKVCSTHTYADRVRTLEAAHRCGIETCSGFILGMGESSSDVVELAFRLRELEVPSIPVNFLIPIEGNPLKADGSLTPERCLRTLALVRFVNPRAEIRAAGGREGHLRALEPLALYPANSLFVEGYLTTRGDAVADTYRMIRDAGFEIEGNPLFEAGAESTGAFRLTGTDGEILKPEITRQP